MSWISRQIKKYLPSVVFKRLRSYNAKESLVSFENSLKDKQLDKLSEASRNLFTYHGEDGILHYLLGKLQGVSPFFIDLGAGDCIQSNCASFAYHFAWNGIFIDKNQAQLSVGKKFYRKRVLGGADLKFIPAAVSPQNINHIIEQNCKTASIGLLSVDIDGNDYWIWKAIESIKPAIVVIEAKVEYGLRNIVVPYSENNLRSFDERYNGASVPALVNLAESKGYKFAGANKQGYNLFFVLQEANIPGTRAEMILGDKEISACFYPDSFFVSHKFVSG